MTARHPAPRSARTRPGWWARLLRALGLATGPRDHHRRETTATALFTARRTPNVLSVGSPERLFPVATASQPEPDPDPSPSVRVHDERLIARSAPVRLTPSEAMHLAAQGAEALRRHRHRWLT